MLAGNNADSDRDRDRDMDGEEYERLGLLQAVAADDPSSPSSTATVELAVRPTTTTTNNNNNSNKNNSSEHHSRIAIAAVVAAYFIVSIALVLVNKELLKPGMCMCVCVYVCMFVCCMLYVVCNVCLLSSLPYGRYCNHWILFVSVNCRRYLYSSSSIRCLVPVHVYRWAHMGAW
jgi:hypothetical protein